MQQIGTATEYLVLVAYAGGNVAKLLLKCYLIMLVCTATLTVGFYVVAAYYASRIDSVVDENWDDVQFQVRETLQTCLCLSSNLHSTVVHQATRT